VRMTYEDFEAFLHVKRRLARGGITFEKYIAQIIVGDVIDADLMLAVTGYPCMVGTIMAQQTNPDFQMPRPLARIAPKFLKIRSELRS
jgi:hypothetical protein